MTPLHLAQSIKSAAHEIGFSWSGICPATAPPGLSRFYQWLESGYHGQMEYLATRKDAYAHPRSVMDGARSILMLALPYDTVSGSDVPTGYGRVSRYAWGSRDYHDVIHERLKALKARVLELRPESMVRGVVDTAPLLEREFAVLAGLGWQGKNTLVLNKNAGSWFFLAALLLNFELPADAPHETDHCGTCRACLDACPTDAFAGPNLLDATKCISYLTIELRSPIPRDLRPAMGDWIFGCDVCQDVCPWNSKSTETSEPAFQPLQEMNPLNLIALFDLTDDQFRRRFRKTPLWRPKRRGILRNAAIVLGNQKDPESIAALSIGLNDAEPLIRGACAWALHQFEDGAANDAIKARFAIEEDPAVIAELTNES